MRFNSTPSKQDLKTEIATLKGDVFKWSAPILIGQVAVFAAIVQVLG